MSAAAAKVILSPIPVDLKIIRGSFTQDGEHKERWKALYQKLLNAKRGVKKMTVKKDDTMSNKHPYPLVKNIVIIILIY